MNPRILCRFHSIIENLSRRNETFSKSLASLRQLISSNRGSATIEFSLLAIPLFIPLFIYISNFAFSSDLQDSMRTLARESARAFVLSKNDETAFQVARDVFLEGGKALGYETEIGNNSISMEIQCSANPCISSNAKVTILVKAIISGEKTISVGAIEYVSPWA